MTVRANGDAWLVIILALTSLVIWAFIKLRTPPKGRDK